MWRVVEEWEVGGEQRKVELRMMGGLGKAGTQNWDWEARGRMKGIWNGHGRPHTHFFTVFTHIQGNSEESE